MQLPIVVILCLCVHFNDVSLHPQSSSPQAENNSWKALESAINTGNEDELRRLLMDRRNLDVTNRHGDTPLIVAAKRGFERMIEMLIENGANVNAVNKDNSSALIQAAWWGNENAVRVLIENGADIHIVNTMNDNNALMAALSEGHEKIAEILIRNGADVNFTMKSGATPLSYATSYGLEKIVQLLTEKGAKANNSALIHAAQNGHEQTLSLLLQNGANVNQVIGGETALHAVATSGNEKIARLLIHNGADFTIKNKDGKSASDLATESGYTQLAHVLQQNVAQKACDIYSNISVVTRIWNGEDVTSDHEFPWMAALGYFDSNYNISFNCGGTLISEKFILTAMHCVQPRNPPVVVRLGKINLIDDITEKIPEKHHVKYIIRHPDYSFQLKTNDIALIELEERVYFSKSIRPACLETYLADESPDLDLTVAGWGIVDPKYRNRSNILRRTNLKTVPSAECSTILMNYAQTTNQKPFRNGTLQSHYCAADPEHMTDTCQGDSGGALQRIRKYFDLSTVVGVVSTGPVCGGRLPGIYTRVAYFIDWIESYVWPNGEIPTPQINQAELDQ